MQTAPATAPKQRWKLYVLIIGAACLLLPWLSIFDNFPMADDFLFSQIKDPFWFGGRQRLGGGADLFRPATSFLFWLSFQVFGGGRVIQHSINFVMHVAVATLVGMLFFRYRKSRSGALFAGALFFVGLHSADVVTWISGRNDLYATVPALFSILGYDTYLRSGKRAWSWAAALSMALAMLSKESVVFFLGILLLWQYLVPPSEVKVNRQERVTTNLALVMVSVGYFLLRFFFTGGFLLSEGSTAQRPTLGLLKIKLPFVMYGLFSPVSHFGDYDQFKFLAWVLAPLLLLLVFLVPWTLEKRFPRDVPVVLGCLFFAAVPAFFALPPTLTVQRERVLYFPFAFVCLAFARALSARLRPAAFMSVAGVVLLASGISLYESNQGWDATSRLAERQIASLGPYLKKDQDVYLVMAPGVVEGRTVWHYGLPEAIEYYYGPNLPARLHMHLVADGLFPLDKVKIEWQEQPQPARFRCEIVMGEANESPFFRPSQTCFRRAFRPDMQGFRLFGGENRTIAEILPRPPKNRPYVYLWLDGPEVKELPPSPPGPG